MKWEKFEECDRAMDGIVCERWQKYKGVRQGEGIRARREK